MNVSRRNFLGSALAGTAAGLTGLACAQTVLADQPNGSGYIDTHVHVWHPDLEKYPLGSDFGLTDMQPKSFTAAELFAHCRPVGVNRIVLIQMNFYEYDHTYMLECMDQNSGVFSAVGLVDHHSEGLEKEMDRLAERGVRGFRLHSHGDADQWVDDTGMGRLWRHAIERGLAVCPLINSGDIPYVDALCERFPETTVVVDHFARIGVDGTIRKKPLGELCRLARFPHVNVKTSAFYALGNKRPPYKDLLPMIERVCESFGPERVMWASDCPFQVQGIHDYESSLALIRDHLPLSSDEKHQILTGTAERVFFSRVK